MSSDLGRAIHAYAGYLDEVLPTVNVDDAVAAHLSRPQTQESHAEWYWRPAVVFIAAIVAVLLIALVPVALLGGRAADVVELPATTSPEPEAAPTVATTLPIDSSDPSVIKLAPTADTDPVDVPTSWGVIEFVTMGLPADPQFLPSGVTGTVHGAVAVGNDTLWWSTEYDTWHATPIGHDSGFASIVDDDTIAIPGSAGVTRFVWEGDEWTRQETVGTPAPVDKMVFGSHGAVARSGDTIYFSSDGLSFTEASRGPDLGVFWAATNVPEIDRDFGDCRATFGAMTARLVDVLATDAGFVALTAAEHPGEDVCAPFLWFSIDGNTWDLVEPVSPFGDLSIVDAGDRWRPIAVRDGRFVATGAVGGMGIAEIEDTIWVSDDALTWRRIVVEGLGGLVSTGAGEMGWLLIDVAEGDGVRMRLSVDAETWDGPYVLPGGLTVGWFVPQFAVTDDAIVAFDIAEQIIVVGRPQEGNGDRS